MTLVVFLVFLIVSSQGIKFIFQEVPKKFEKNDAGRVVATWGSDEQHSDEFDTVLLAIGRTPDVQNVNDIFFFVLFFHLMRDQTFFLFSSFS